MCLGLPGALPVLNGQAVDLAVAAALALGCTVHETSVFARKNYFYPDLPKGYQISQYERPLATGGRVEHRRPTAATSAIRLTRIHMEEDAGKSLHEGFPDSDRRTYVDFNRSGVPLIEIVSEPDLRSPDRGRGLLRERLRRLLVWIGVNDGNMEEGSLRCDANVSVRPRGRPTLGTKVEVKNLNSFRYLQKALEYEIEPPDRLRRRAAGGSCRKRGSATPRTGGRSRCAARKRRTTTATSRSPTCRRCVVPEARAARVAAAHARAARRAARAVRRALRGCPTTTPAC